MSNALHHSVTRYRELPRVITPASAYASAYSLDPDQKKPLLEPVPRQDWDYALAERIGIMEDSGILSNRASALATADTVSNYGHRPAVGL